MVNMAEKWTNQQEISICVANLTSRKSGISAAKYYFQMKMRKQMVQVNLEIV